MELFNGMMTAVVTIMGMAIGCNQAVAQSTNQPPTESIEKLQRLIAPAPGESQWMQVPWMPSSNIYAARKNAAEEGKPLLLWYMAGEPLGTC